MRQGCVLPEVQLPAGTALSFNRCSHHRRHPLPILFLTGHGDIPSSVSAMRDGAEDFLKAGAEGTAPRRREARPRPRRAVTTVTGPPALSARALRRTDPAGIRSARPCRARQAQQADCRQSRHPRADSQASSHGHHDETSRAIGRRAHGRPTRQACSRRPHRPVHEGSSEGLRRLSMSALLPERVVNLLADALVVL